MNSIKMVFVIAISTATFIGIGLGCIKLLDISDETGSIAFCILMGIMGLAIGLVAALTEIECKYQNKPTATKKKLKSKTDEAYAAPEKE